MTGPKISPALEMRLRGHESTLRDHDEQLEVDTVKLNANIELTAKIMKNLAALMTAQGVPVVGLTEDEIDELHGS